MNDQFDPRTQVQDIVDEEADPLIILMKLEAQLVHTYHFNIQGNPVMSNAINPTITPEVAAKLVHTRYTDVMDIIGDKLSHESLKARVTSSMAWMLDQTIVTQARVFLFNEFKESELVGTADGLDNFMHEFVGSLQVEEVFGGNGTASTLCQMLGLRQEWHDIASSAADADGRRYEPRSFEALIHDEKAQTLKPDQRKRMQMMVKAMLEMDGGDEKEEADLVKLMAERADARAMSRVELNRKVGPTVLDVIAQATRHSQHSRFEELDEQLRERLIKTSLKFVKNAALDLGQRSMSDAEYLGILMEMKAYNAEINKVLIAQYSDRGHRVIDKTQHRNEKRAAARSEHADFEAATSK